MRVRLFFTVRMDILPLLIMTTMLETVIILTYRINDVALHPDRVFPLACSRRQIWAKMDEVD